MKINLMLSTLTFGIGGFFACQPRLYNQAEATTNAVSELQEDVEAAMKKVQKSALALSGANSIGIGECDEFWTSIVLDERVIDIVRKKYVGLVIGFAKKDDLKNFANASRVLGTNVKVLLDSTSKKSVDVMVCGMIKSTVQPERIP